MNAKKPVDKLKMTPSPLALSVLLDTDSETAYHIPLYQRDYKWGVSEVSDFLQDVLDSYRASTQRFYGTILLSDNAPQPDPKGSLAPSYVIDGQQRLTTSLLALAAMRHLAIEMSEELPEAITLATRINDRVTLAEQDGLREPRLFANRANYEFLSLMLSESTSSRNTIIEKFNTLKPKLTQRRSKPLLDAYQQCYRSLRDATVSEVLKVKVDDENDGTLTSFFAAKPERVSAVKYLDEIKNHLLNHSIFIRIQIENWSDAFELFDGLNNRGMELAKKDVLKNLLLSRAARLGEKTISEVEKSWQSLDDATETFSSASSNGFTRFLRHWMLLTNEDVTLSGVTRLLINSTVDEPARETVERLVEAALHYSAIARPDSNLTPDVAVLRHLENLRTLSAERTRPIILAAMLQNLNSKKMVQLLNALENLQFRRSAICQLDNKTLEGAVQKIAFALFNEGDSGVGKAIKAIESLNPSDEIFLDNFRTKTAIPVGVATYLLLRIENYLRANAKQPSLDPEDVTLEHVLPQSPQKHWKLKAESAEVKSLIGQIGNLTLLTGTVNSESSNLGFDAKKSLYGAEENLLFISRDILKNKSWGKEEIAARQKKLGDLASEVWKI